MEENDDILDEKIEAYLTNKMNREERESFEANMQDDYALYDRVLKDAKLYRMASIVASGNINEEKIEKLERLSETIKGIKNEYVFTEKKAVNGYILWPAAAAILLALFLSIKFLYIDKMKHNDIYNNYYKPISSFFSIEKNYILNDSSLVKGFMNLYDNQNYDAFINQYKQVNVSKNVAVGDKSVLQFYAGVALMEQEQHPKAVEQFQQIQKGDLFYTEAQWYMALSCISEDDIKNAKELLNDLIGVDNQYSDEARAILNEL